MKRTVFAWAIAMLVGAAPALAQRGGSTPHGASGSKPQVTKPQPPKPQSPKPQPPKVQGAKATAIKPSSTGPKTPPRGGTSTKPSAMKPKTTVTAKTAGKSSASASAKTITSSKTTAMPTLTPVQLKLQRNTNLASKLQSRLPAGTDLQAAAARFRNLGQFVAAVNVSNNLGIPFTALKTRMVDQGMSLGQAIQDARPTTTGTTVVARRAESDADDLIRATEPRETRSAKDIKGTKKTGGRK